MAAKSKIKCFECIKGNGNMIFVEWNFSNKRQKEKHPKNIGEYSDFNAGLTIYELQ